MKQYIKLLRPHHYIKNILVFAALGCSGHLLEPERFLACLTGFAALCAVSSAVYIINDIRDRDKDRLHPGKCRRPIASGAVSVPKAQIMALVLLLVGFGLNAPVFRLSSTIMLAVYLLLNIAYSFGLKNIPIVDISILVAGFLLRVLYGADITGISVSNWLYLTVIALAFYFALGKRRNEVMQLGDDAGTRKVLRRYPVSFLDKNMYMCLGLANVFYALWSMDEKTISHYSSNDLIFTVPIVLLITMKYSFDIEGKSDGDPVEVLLHDKVLIALCLLYLSAMFMILYL